MKQQRLRRCICVASCWLCSPSCIQPGAHELPYVVPFVSSCTLEAFLKDISSMTKPSSGVPQCDCALWNRYYTFCVKRSWSGAEEVLICVTTDVIVWMTDVFAMESLAADFAEPGECLGKWGKSCWAGDFEALSSRLCPCRSLGASTCCLPVLWLQLARQPVLSLTKMFSLDCVPCML